VLPQLIGAEGVTATPERADGRGLGVQAGGCFDDLVLGPSIAELIKGKFLTPVRVFAPATSPDLAGVRIKMGDYDTVELKAAMDVPTLTGDAVEHYARHCAGRPAIAFCVSVDHAKNVAAAFRAAGWRAEAADGSIWPQRSEMLPSAVSPRARCRSSAHATW
jgi:DNA repair protein RadD